MTRFLTYKKIASWSRRTTTKLLLLSFLTITTSFAQISSCNPYPTSDMYVQGVTPAPDGTIWFTTANRNVGNVSLFGNLIGIYSLPYSGSSPAQIVTGADGNLWFVDAGTNSIGRITVAIVPPIVKEWTLPTANALPTSIIAGSDGALWFTEESGNNIGRITVNGRITEYPVTTQQSRPIEITAGSDGALWFTESQAVQIGRITTAGTITAEYSISDSPFGITTGEDGALWFTEGDYIGRLTTSGSLTEYEVNRGYDQFLQMTTGPEGSLWFIDYYGVYYPYLGQIPTSGAFPIFNCSSSSPQSLATGPDGSIWIADWYSGSVIQAIPVSRRNAIDVSAASTIPSAAQLTDFQSAGIDYAVVEGSQQGSNNPHEVLQAFQQYSSQGFTFGTAAYCFLYLYSGNTFGTGSQQVQACLSSLQNELRNGSLAFIALDVECYQPDQTKPPCYSANYESLAARVQDITEAINTLSVTQGVKRILIYTNSSNWSFLSGGNKTLQQLASSYGLWNAAHGSFVSYADPAGNLSCSSAQTRAKSLTPQLHGGTGIPNLALPATITALSLSNNVVTLTANNSFLAGEKVVINGLRNAFLNGKTLTILASGLYPSQFAADFTHADVQYTGDSGTATFLLFGGWQVQSGTQYDIGVGGKGACLFGLNVDFDVLDPSLF